MFEILFEEVRCDAIEIWLRHNFEVSLNIFGEMQWIFNCATYWNFITIVSMRCNGISTKTHFGTVLE